MQQRTQLGAHGGGLAVLGVLFLFVAGFAFGRGQYGNDPELTAGVTFALGAAGLVCVLAAGIAIGLRLGRS